MVKLEVRIEWFHFFPDTVYYYYCLISTMMVCFCHVETRAATTRSLSNNLNIHIHRYIIHYLP